MFHSEKPWSNDSAASKSSYQVGSKDSSSEVDFMGVEESFAKGSFHAQDELAFATSQRQQQLHFEDFGNLDDLYLDVFSPTFQLCEDEWRKILGITENTEPAEPNKSQSFSFPFASFEVLREYRSKRLKPDGESSITGYKIQPARARSPSLLTETTVKFAAQKFIESMCQNSKGVSMPNHPCPGSLLAHSGVDSKEVELVQNLLSCAEKIAENQYEPSMKFLEKCEKSSSRTGTPIQRLVFYFTEALFEKIARATGRTVPFELEKKPVDPLEMVQIPNMTLHFAFLKDYPLSQITKLVGMQAILDHLGESTKVHMIDLEIRSGVQWIILMQALAARSKLHPIQHLKITAIASECKPILEETGKHLASFAHSLHLKFTFKIVLVEDILELHENLFDLDADESVAIYTSCFLTSIFGRVDRLNHLMTVMRNINPCVMIVTELEVNCKSPSFMGRVLESLFLFGAFFDSLADCLENDQTSRTDAESVLFRWPIRHVLAADEDERTILHVNINVWRAFFARLGLVELGLSKSSLDQATLGLQNFSCGSSCTLYRDGKCLTIGWKGTPLKSISAWKFQRDLWWIA